MFDNISIFTKPGCVFCERAKSLLNRIFAPFEEIVLDPLSNQYESRVAELIKRTGHRTFPQVFIGEEFIGGFEELMERAYKPSHRTLTVIKRSGAIHLLSFDKIVKRIDLMSNYPSTLAGINAVALAQSIISLIHDKIKTKEIDDLLITSAANKGFSEPDYLTLAARLHVNNLHKRTLQSFKDKMELLVRNVDARGEPFPKVKLDFFVFVCKHQKEIEKVIDYRNDYLFDYFGLKTLEKGYLQTFGSGEIVERPQDALMRESIFLYYMNPHDVSPAELLSLIFESYKFRSQKYFTHASPTIFNAGTLQPGCISCFLLDVDDSTTGISNVAKSCMFISKACGGIGFSMSKMRSKGSDIKGSNGKTQGIVPFMQHMETLGRYFNQSSKREGKIALYLDVHHPDVISFLRTKLISGNNQEYCKDVSTALWVSDMFMKRVREDGVWSMFNPQYYPQLLECYGEEYEKMYTDLEEKGDFTSQIPAREVWKEICLAQGSSGMPYILFKDQINRVSNQKNIGIVRSSNLCAEIVEVADFSESNPSSAEFACCTLTSVALPEFVVCEEKEVWFDFEKFEKVIRVVVRNLNNVIDATYYPVRETERSNLAHRPLGIGVQGLADVFAKFKFAYDSEEAEKLNAAIFEYMYYYALKASNELAIELYEKKAAIANRETVPTTIGAYSSFKGSPLSKGILNFDNYPTPEVPMRIPKETWDELRESVVKFGVRNSLLLALMPTASTSNILGNTECFEPFTNNVFVRFTLSGEFLVVNKYLVADLKAIGLWNPAIIRRIKQDRGSVQSIREIPAEVRNRYKTVWEISQRAIINLAAGRQRFVCQSQSMNLHFSKLSLSKFTTAMFMGWEKGLKTGVYYMRTQMSSRPDADVILTAKQEEADCCSA